jgi:hypothetical protein
MSNNIGYYLAGAVLVFMGYTYSARAIHSYTVDQINKHPVTSVAPPLPMTLKICRSMTQTGASVLYLKSQGWTLEKELQALDEQADKTIADKSHPDIMAGPGDKKRFEDWVTQTYALDLEADKFYELGMARCQSQFGEQNGQEGSSTGS